VIIQVLTAADVKMTLFWVVVPCVLIEVTDVSEVLAASIVGVLPVLRMQCAVSELYCTEHTFLLWSAGSPKNQSF
jgi:hypothetical protein